METKESQQNLQMSDSDNDTKNWLNNKENLFL